MADELPGLAVYKVDVASTYSDDSGAPDYSPPTTGETSPSRAPR